MTTSETRADRASAAAVETHRLRKVYKDVVAVDDLDLSIGEGELFSLLGINGAGKTTTISMLTGLTRPDGGEARILGHSVTEEPAAVKALVDISMQETAVARKLTVEENIRFYAGLCGLDKAGTDRVKAEIYAAFGLGTVAGKQAARLSGGWQRKLSIALALIKDPRVLFLDEPTLGLDVIARRELWNTIRGLKGRMTIVLTTHYMEEAEALSDRIGIMKDGRLLFVGTKEELYAASGKDNVEDAFIDIVKGGEKDA